MRRLAISCLVFLAACASGGASSSTTDQQTLRVTGAGGSSTFNLRTNTNVNVSRVSYPVDKVWRLMPSVYDSLKIPLSTVDGAKHTIGNDGMKIRSKLGGVALSKYIDCGQAQIGPSADTYDVFLTVLTTVSAVSTTETELQTTVESSAKPITFNQEYSRCSTKGKLETTIADIVTAKLAAAK